MTYAIAHGCCDDASCISVCPVQRDVPKELLGHIGINAAYIGDSSSRHPRSRIPSAVSRLSVHSGWRQVSQDSKPWTLRPKAGGGPLINKPVGDALGDKATDAREVLR